MLISLIAVGVSGLGVPYILNVGLWALAAGSAFTFWQRVRAVYLETKETKETRETRETQPSEAGPDG
jgi:CDP-diacylglycerol--glycerol-3-phosphate 3-phosphatidyltransferase